MVDPLLLLPGLVWLVWSELLLELLLLLLWVLLWLLYHSGTILCAVLVVERLLLLLLVSVRLLLVLLLARHPCHDPVPALHVAGLLLAPARP